MNLIAKINPNCNIIFTVSPVRHIKDGFIENQVSKSHLLSSIYKVLQIPPSGTEKTYFPSYEIMMDELRDYRFYDTDMLHPNQLTIDYIWQQFYLSYISESVHQSMNDISVVQKSIAHKPFNEKSESHQKFLLLLENKINSLKIRVEPKI